MNSTPLLSLSFDRVNVVGVVESVKGLDVASKLTEEAIDVLEFRLDQQIAVPADDLLNKLSLPWIATVRDSAEGGNPALSQDIRLQRFQEAVGRASAIDVELRNVKVYSTLLKTIATSASALILSHHNFQTAPSLAVARELLRQAVDAGADIFKLAVTPQRPSEVGMLMELLDAPEIPVSLMSMGRFGLAGRLIYATCGSVLNYGWLEKPVVSGQWQAVELKRQIALVSSTGDLK